MAKLDSSRVELVVLARLLSQSPRSKARELRAAIERTVAAACSLDEARQAVGTVLATLVEQGHCTDEPLALTKAGQTRAREALGLAAKSPVPRWQVLEARLAGRAAGLRPGRGSRQSGADAMRAALLRTRLNLDVPEEATFGAVLDAWAARELGLAGKKLTLANVRAHLLARALGLTAVRDAKQVASIAVAKVANAESASAASVRTALLRDFLRNGSDAKHAANDAHGNHETSTTTQGRRAAAESMDLPAFADAIQRLARTATEGRFGRHKVFVSSLYEQAKTDPAFAHLDAATFKKRLLEAHRSELLQLARADLTSAMSPELVQASEIPYLNAVFHFVHVPEASR